MILVKLDSRKQTATSTLGTVPSHESPHQNLALVTKLSAVALCAHAVRMQTTSNLSSKVHSVERDRHNVAILTEKNGTGHLQVQGGSSLI